MRSLFGDFWICTARRRIVKPIATPFAYIAVHVVKSPIVWPLLPNFVCMWVAIFLMLRMYADEMSKVPSTEAVASPAVGGRMPRASPAPR